MTATKTMTLPEFLKTYAACRVWYVSLGAPTGSELIVNTDEDAGEDYCDAETLLGADPVPQAIAESATGTVSDDGDGETRWEWDGAGADLRDCRSNTVTRLVVWGE